MSSDHNRIKLEINISKDKFLHIKKLNSPEKYMSQKINHKGNSTILWAKWEQK